MRAWQPPPFLVDYAKVLSGSVGRLGFSLVYFLIVANALTLAEFGLFATASAVGVVLSRLAAFGFISPLFRCATVRRRLVGTYLAGFAALFALSLPVIGALALGVHAVLFGETLAVGVFALLIAAEVLGWRVLEVVTIVNNGLRRFGRASSLVLVGSAVRTVAAVLFWVLPEQGLSTWAWIYLAANLLAALIALAAFLPKVRWRWRPVLYRRRMEDAALAALADMVFYIQAEIDKALVLALAGPRVAGLYAIALRVIDLTALPVRSFNQLLIQKIMGDRGFVAGPARRILIEAAVAAVSVLGFAAVIVLASIRPGWLGANITAAAALFPLLLAVPAFRNLVEYHAELLYARERGRLRVGLLLVAGAIKAGLMAWAISASASETGWFASLNLVFLAVWAVSAAITYPALRRRP
jgi:O-antigen/teichoic acid export membrane protein